MSKQDLINKVSENENLGFLTKVESQKVVNSVFEAIEDVLKDGGDISIIGFGKLFVKESPERKGRNPQTGESLILPARKSVKFKASKKLNEKLNEKIA